ncbi:hypothetical protein [Legionella hackeliae]|uniref:Uncharacterized protein n=1 Tax=Legionella hackeliae TaxID=449 RepID=A0A0A8UP36_LEGHA|nr:hypothetical protein [Legionella hackeliae]KTD13812.1 hypothetical protein Lhac_0656 [Legionella hackeliae]CEK10513.1 protein of unknown function [Legionella hackeliae]STX47250.1 Uncharacterised protein [Legionella hackeliae]
MFTGEELQQLIEQTQKSPVLFSSSLDPDTIALMQEDSLLTTEFFRQLSIATPGELTAPQVSLIKNFLRARGDLLKKGSLAYTRHPFLPVNQLCLKIAEAIASPEEAVCQLLMPTVKTLNRSTYSLKQETEEDGHFAIENYILSDDFTRLIPVEEIFQQAKVNTETVFPEYQESSQNLHYQLSNRDFLDLQEVAGDESRLYLNALRAHHAQHYSDKSIGFAIKTLAIALKKGSVSGLGSEEHAESRVVAEAIKDFYDLWNHLPIEIRKTVGSTILIGYGNAHTLYQYFLALFYGHPQCKLTSEELALAKKDNIFNCIDIISNALNEALIQHPEFYEINIDGVQQSDLPELLPLLKNAVSALKARPQMLSDDRYLWETLLNLLTMWSGPVDEQKFEALVRMGLHAETYEHIEKLFPHIASITGVNDIAFSEKINELILRLQSKLVCLKENNLLSLPQFISVLPDKSQSIAITTLWPKIYPLLSDNDSFNYIWNRLKPTGRDCLVDLFAKQLTQSVNTTEDCIRVLRSPIKIRLIEVRSISLLREKCIELLKPQFVFLFNTPKLAKKLLSLLPSSYHQEVLASLLPNVLKGINSYSVFLETLQEWGDSAGVDAILSQVASQWIDEYESLLSSVKRVNAKSQLYLCETFRHLVITKEQLFKLLTFVHRDSQLDLLGMFEVKKFVTNIDILKELLTLLKPSFRDEVISLFRGEDLHCTEEDFEKLKKPAVDISEWQQKLSEYTQTRSLFSQSLFFKPNSNRMQMIREINTYLEQHPNLTRAEYVTFFCQKMREIEKSYSTLANPRRSHLYTILSDLVDNISQEPKNEVANISLIM